MSPMEEMVERFLDAAARGDLVKVTSMLSHSTSLTNQKGEKDWTALMMAARNGHFDVVQTLLSYGYSSLLEHSFYKICYIYTPHIYTPLYLYPLYLYPLAPCFL